MTNKNASNKRKQNKVSRDEPEMAQTSAKKKKPEGLQNPSQPTLTPSSMKPTANLTIKEYGFTPVMVQQPINDAGVVTPVIPTTTNATPMQPTTHSSSDEFKLNPGSVSEGATRGMGDGMGEDMGEDSTNPNFFSTMTMDPTPLLVPNPTSTQPPPSPNPYREVMCLPLSLYPNAPPLNETSLQLDIAYQEHTQDHRDGTLFYQYASIVLCRSREQVKSNELNLELSPISFHPYIYPRTFPCIVKIPTDWIIHIQWGVQLQP